MKLATVLRGTTTIDRVHVSRGTDRFDVASQGVAIDRAELDQRLVEQAVARGVTFVSSTSAKLVPLTAASITHRQSTAALPRKNCPPKRELVLSSNGISRRITAMVVLASDGINGTLLNDEPWASWTIGRRAWMGTSCTLPLVGNSIAAGAIHMNIGTGGYVGLVQLPNHHVHVGAALDARSARALGGPGAMIESILRDNGIDIKIDHLHGAGLLTRHRQTIGGQRVLCVGDACGYVEPFTGEGIAWALASAEAVVSLLPMDLNEWLADLPTRWKKLHRQVVGSRQRICRLVRFAVRRPTLWRLAAILARCWPTIVTWIAPRPTLQLAGDTHD